jgi:hypothetical protein
MIFKFSAFLYIFLLFNRVFVPFIDLRMILLPMFFYLIVYKILVLIKNKEITFFATKNIFLILLLFLFLVIISNFKWFFNDYSPNEEVFINALILYTYNFLAIIVFSLYWKSINTKLFGYFFLISGGILWLSLIAQYLGMENLPFASEAVRGGFEEEFSLIGIRFGGYAEDQNYATLGMIFWFILTSIFLEKRILSFIVLILSFVGVMISFSKTILLGAIFILLLFTAKKIKMLLPFIVISVFVLVFSAFYLYELLSTLSTMSTRFVMWEIAFNGFLDNPLLGSGNTSVRSNFLNEGYWYVQPHNSFLAMLHDNGIFILVLYILFFLKSFNVINLKYKFIVLIILFLSFTQELFVFQYPYFALGILPIIVLLKQNNIHTTKIRI